MLVGWPSAHNRHAALDTYIYQQQFASVLCGMPAPGLAPKATTRDAFLIHVNEVAGRFSYTGARAVPRAGKSRKQEVIWISHAAYFSARSVG